MRQPPTNLSGSSFSILPSIVNPRSSTNEVKAPDTVPRTRFATDDEPTSTDTSRYPVVRRKLVSSFFAISAGVPIAFLTSHPPLTQSGISLNRFFWNLWSSQSKK
eukprot:TRINITY_DN2842_c0_g1_i3.p1 TRINITY_DN2842_c0_g1~~TRINITY_DN2842_c0_g1_i3.p1  ORF type:complete len:105 (-),score=0.94 TRINITY_DN2842_c0_g1_i3:128-442(-)